MVAHLYNQGLQWHHGKQEVIYTIKNVKDAFHGDYQGGCCMLDLERGVVSEVHPEPWQTDTCVGEWFYKRGITYKTPQVVVQMLVDIKNGNLDAEEDRIVEGIAKWMAVNSEAIYSTRSWKLFGEGPTQAAGGQFSERKAKVYTPEDIRFTSKGKTLYATLLAWPEKQALIKSLGTGSAWPGKIRKVTMLGVDQTLKFSPTARKG
jgi:alpha-L-fucosidase